MYKKIGVTIVILLLLLTILPISSGMNYTIQTKDDSQEIDNIEDDIKDTRKTKTIGDGKTEYWGLFIAVGEYADNPVEDRPHMFRYVDSLQDILLESETWSEDHIKVIKGKNATVRNIIKGFQWLDSKEDADDISFVSLDSHGGPIKFDFFPKDEKDGTDEHLLT